MKKNEAISYLTGRGYKINDTVTFASKNKVSKLYWANPNFSVLENDWTLILNDIDNKILYLFDIKADSILESQLLPRLDKSNQIDIRIIYEDASFTESRSLCRFYDYLVATEKY